MLRKNIFPYPDMRHILAQAKVYNGLFAKTKQYEKIIRAQMNKHGVWDNNQKLFAVLQCAPSGQFCYDIWCRYYELNPDKQGCDISESRKSECVQSGQFPELKKIYDYLQAYSIWLELRNQQYETILGDLVSHGWDKDENRLCALLDYLPKPRTFIHQRIETLASDLKIERICKERPAHY